MDALEFLRGWKRMCNSYKDCDGCPLAESNCVINHVTSDEDCERIVATVEQWSAEHPRKTRQSVFLGNYPCARIDRQSVLYACPADVYGDNVCPKKKDAAPITCYECRREFWPQEVE